MILNERSTIFLYLSSDALLFFFSCIASATSRLGPYVLIMERSQLLQKFSGWISRLSACFGSYHNRFKHSSNSQNQYSFSSITWHCLLFRKSDLSYPRRSRRLVNPDDVLVERPEAVLVHGQQRTYHLPFCYLTYMYTQPLQPPLSSTSLIHLRTPRFINNNHNCLDSNQ
jgi:hypothetical protein